MHGKWNVRGRDMIVGSSQSPIGGAGQGGDIIKRSSSHLPISMDFCSERACGVTPAAPSTIFAAAAVAALLAAPKRGEGKMSGRGGDEGGERVRQWCKGVERAAAVAALLAAPSSGDDWGRCIGLRQGVKSEANVKT